MNYNPNKLDFNFLKNYSSSQLLYESLSVGLISTNGYYFTYSPKLLNQKELDGFEKITVSEFLKNDSIWNSLSDSTRKWFLSRLFYISMMHFEFVLKFSYMGLKIGNEKHQELLTETPFLLPMQFLTFNHMHKALSSSETFIYCYGLTLDCYYGATQTEGGNPALCPSLRPVNKIYSTEHDSRFFKDWKIWREAYSKDFCNSEKILSIMGWEAYFFIPRMERINGRINGTEITSSTVLSSFLSQDGDCLDNLKKIEPDDLIFPLYPGENIFLITRENMIKFPENSNECLRSARTSLGI